jgi:hypothetical protein
MVEPVRRRSVSRVLGFLLAAGAMAAAAWWMLGRPATLAVVNRFDTPLQITAPDGTTRIIPPRQRGEVRMAAPGFARLTWTAAARTGTDGRPRGESPSGELSLELPRGTTERNVGLGDARVAMFEPLITNAGTRPLEIVVNHGLRGGRACDCAIEPGTVRESAGYYALYRNTTVRAVDPAGRTATFENLGPEVDRRLWKVGLRFVDADFR